MKKEMTLAAVREMLGEKTYETETGFTHNDFGKYCPNITYILPKSFELDGTGKVISPIQFTSDREVTDNMNLDFDGDASFMFGDFWRSKKGGACFRPKNPNQAKDLLICVNWGGCFNSHRGNWSDDVAEIDGIKYFRRASSNGGGSGYDYWVVPVGFSRVIHDEEIDGNTKTDRTAEFERRAKAYRAKHAKLQREESEANDKALKAKLAAEKESRRTRAELLDQVTEFEKRLDALRGKGCCIDRFEIGDTYFKCGCTSYLFTAENIAEMEERVARNEAWVAETVAKKEALAKARAEFESQFRALEKDLVELDWVLEMSDEKAKIKNPHATFNRYSGYGNEFSSAEFPFSADGVGEAKELLAQKLTELHKKQAEQAAAEAKAKAEAEAKALGLPSDVRLWHRNGATNAGCAWVIDPKGMDRECDEVDTMVCGSNSKRYHQNYEGDHVWHQIMPGELVIYWAHAYTAADHEFTVIYRPETLTEAQLERVAEIQQELEEEFFGKAGLTGTRSCPSIGKGWGLF